MAELNSRVVVITGAAGGIGAGIAQACAAAGAHLVLHHHRSDAPTSTAEHLSVRADLTDPTAADDLIAAAVARFGTIDVLVNNAATQTIAAFMDTDDAAWSEMMATNLDAAHRLTRAFAQHVTARGGEGSVIHIASIEGTQPAVMHGHYGVSKAGLIMHAKAAAVELGPLNIRVNAVSPGLIGRPGIAEAWPDGVERWETRAPLRRMGTPADIGDACVFLASDRARWITGTNLVVDGGMSACSTW